MKKTQDSKRSKDLRRQRNIDVIRRMRNGESLTSFDSRASWFPPRPTIQKDRSEIARLYDQRPAGEGVKRVDLSNVVRLAISTSTTFDEAG